MAGGWLVGGVIWSGRGEQDLSVVMRRIIVCVNIFVHSLNAGRCSTLFTQCVYNIYSTFTHEYTATFTRPLS